MEKNPVMLLVLGVHRSGTSTVARLLECLAAEPSRNLLEGDRNNPKGYFEDVDVTMFNRHRLLHALGSSWHHTAPPDWARLTDGLRSELKEEAAGILERNFKPGNPVSVLKDPQITDLLPFWLEVLEKSGYRVKIVCSLRDPLSVARSLRVRDGFSVQHGSMIYAAGWMGALRAMQGLTPSFVSYDRMVSDPRATLFRLSSETGLPLPEDVEQRLAAFSKGFLSPNPGDRISSSDDGEWGTQVFQAATDIHASLLHAEETGIGIKETLDRLGHWFDWLTECAPLLSEYDRLTYLTRFLALGTMRRNRLLKGLGVEPSDDSYVGIEPSIEEAWRVVSESGLFDADYYLANNEDVRMSGMDPLRHYLVHGSEEGRNPSLRFNTVSYLIEHIERAPSMWNPLLSHIEMRRNQAEPKGGD